MARVASCGNGAHEHIPDGVDATGWYQALGGRPSRPDGRQNGNKCGCEPLEIDYRHRQVGLDFHVVEAAPDGAAQPVTGLCLAMEALRPPAMTLVEAPIVLAPVCASATSAEQCRRIVIADHHHLVDAPLGQTVALERTARAVPGLGVEETAMFHAPLRAQGLPQWAFENVVPGIVTEAARRDAALDRLPLRRDQRIDAAAFETGTDLGVGVAGIRRHRSDLATRDSANLVDLGSIVSPSFTSPVVTETSRTTPLASSTAVCCL